jgi:septum formation inhibitor MinC
MNKLTLILATTALLASGSVFAADDAEATIRLMGNAEAELPNAVTREITLPEHLLAADPEDQAATVEKAEKGLSKANERNAHRDQGQDQAAAARERNAEMQEKAKENRENRGRSEDHPEPPDPPGPPETPPGRT